MADVTPIDRAEERRLLALWAAMTQFDTTPDGDPPVLDAEDDDE